MKRTRSRDSALSVVRFTEGGGWHVAAREGGFRGMRKERAPSTMHIRTFYWKDGGCGSADGLFRRVICPEAGSRCMVA